MDWWSWPWLLCQCWNFGMSVRNILYRMLNQLSSQPGCEDNWYFEFWWVYYYRVEVSVPLWKKYLFAVSFDNAEKMSICRFRQVDIYILDDTYRYPLHDDDIWRWCSRNFQIVLEIYIGKYIDYMEVAMTNADFGGHNQTVCFIRVCWALALLFYQLHRYLCILPLDWYMLIIEIGITSVKLNQVYIYALMMPMPLLSKRTNQ